MRAARYKYVAYVAIGLLLTFAVGFAVFRKWQGPQLPSYTVTSMPLVQTVVATGRVVTASRVQVGSEVSGVVLKRLVQEGDQVEKGDLLLVLTSDNIAAQVRQAQATLDALVISKRPQALVELANARVQLEQARGNVKRRRELVAISAISTEEMAQAEQAQSQARNKLDSARLQAAALAPAGVEEQQLRAGLAALQAQLAKTKIRSEVTGTVLTRNIEMGDLVQPGLALFTIALDGNTEIRVPLDERNLSRLTLQQSAIAIADAYPEKPFATRISFIAPSIDPQRGTIEVRLTVDPVPEFLRQDMTVSVNIETGQRTQALVLPNDAFLSTQRDDAVVLLVRNSKIQRQKITLGLRGLTMSEVTSGLNVDDEVLADAAASLADGTRVRSEVQDTPFIEHTSVVDPSNRLPETPK